MTDKSSTPSDRPDPHLDPTEDTDEPAFDWMKPAAPAVPAEDSAAKPAAGPAAAPAATNGSPAAPVAGQPEGRATATNGSAATPVAGQPESRADRKAAEAAVLQAGAVQADAGQARAGTRHDAGHDAAAAEPPQTSALQIRPPQEEVERRNAEREQAAKAKPVLPRVMQVLLAVFYPVILLVLAVRAVTSPLFLWVEYNRPGFPGDGYGFSTDDRMTYGSYAVDYLSNWSGPRYLGDLVDQSGDHLFKDGEVSHMADVKAVILSTFGAGTLLILFSLVAVIYLKRRHRGGVRRGLFAGSILTLAIIIGLGTLAVLGWEQFFTDFHRIFFANGTWTFSLQDTLIRLFPGQFWMDAGIVIGALVLLASLVTLILTWPTRRRRGLGKKAADAPRDEATGKAAGRDSSTATGGDSDADARAQADAVAADGPADTGTAGSARSGAEGTVRTRNTV
ncbi:TIGR01906 family membrane protein [Arthrobacter oryzae]|uniref:Integral membrane protein (TIGR01906 family) n=1 Tax=Arthrobacter oryzae TaxID=409290 RepID=A0A495ET06_9MICC|nr:TIGR01906 family membrane protein [Arthrobacter oryzae]RKR19466.1 integral membrane protein (TIGR01906 family) [Arthrobacter oryzae]